MDIPNPILDDESQTTFQERWEQSSTLEHGKDICIIGAGPSGLAALKIILDHPAYKAGLWRPIAFEAREDVGGIWLPAPPDTADPPYTPLYDSLTTNLPHPVMAYPSFSFPPSTPLYPHASTVLKYLRDYTSHFKLSQHIQFNTRVQSVRWLTEKVKWEVRTESKSSTQGEGVVETKEFDLVIVANGHYRIPRYPSTPGLSAWLDAGHATHSVYYRNPSHPYLTGPRTVLVIGAGPSGLDVSSDLHALPDKRVVHSYTGAANEDLDGGRYKTRPRIKQFLEYDSHNGGTVLFEDGSTESGISHCILATGYQDSFPFLEPPSSDTPPLELGLPPSIPPLPPKLYNSTYHVFPLAKHLFPLTSSSPDSFPPSSLAFLGLPFRVVPFPLVEAQMRAVVKVFEEPSSLDATQEAVEIVSRYEEIRASIPPMYPYDPDVAVAKLWHMLDEHRQFDYRDALHEFVGGEYAKPEWKVPGWVKDMYKNKGVLRAEWKDIDKSGEAEEWVRGVGEGENPKQEWVALMYKVLERAVEKHKLELQKTRL
ncbi:FAD/NAD(P)-binding domain-containing protein [Panus rudis PR-1116 ss-1]|nr:FAD/NAD(P)-binding domain-containing protein [Panus rudis PR-1116 ss-1]